MREKNLDPAIAKAIVLGAAELLEASGENPSAQAAVSEATKVAAFFVSGRIEGRSLRVQWEHDEAADALRGALEGYQDAASKLATGELEADRLGVLLELAVLALLGAPSDGAEPTARPRAEVWQ